MKSPLFFFALLLQLSAFVFGQPPCTTDTLFPPVPPAVSIQTDSLKSPILPCYNYGCKVEYCHIWQLPTNYSGRIEISCNQLTPIEANVQFWQDCHLIRFDSCVMIAQSNVLFWDTILQFPENAQLVVCNSVGPITIAIKPSIAHDTLPPFFVNTDTLCSVLEGMREPLNETIKVGECWQYQNYIWSKVDCATPNIRCKKFWREL